MGGAGGSQPWGAAALGSYLHTLIIIYIYIYIYMYVCVGMYVYRYIYIYIYIYERGSSRVYLTPYFLPIYLMRI